MPGYVQVMAEGMGQRHKCQVSCAWGHFEEVCKHLPRMLPCAHNKGGTRRNRAVQGRHEVCCERGDLFKGFTKRGCGSSSGGSGGTVHT